jgi:murein DD-endopeptidase MepM/ murein hydrolase activator NlpD
MSTPASPASRPASTYAFVLAVLIVACAACATPPAPAVRAPAPPLPAPAPPAAAAPAKAAPAPPGATFTDLAGTWQGVMNEGQPSALQADLQLARLPSGEYVGRVAVPAQGVELRASAIIVNGDAVRFEIKQVGGVFEGTVNPAKTSAKGIWTQPGMDAPAPLVLRRIAGAAAGAPPPKPAVRRGVDALPLTPAPFTMPFTVRVHGRPNVLRSHGASYLVYELEIANAGRRDATILSLDVLAQQRTLAHLAGAALEDVLEQTGRDALVSARAPAGGAVLAFLWLRLDKAADVPRAVAHRLSASVDDFTEPVTSDLAEAAVEESHVAIEPPLRGGPWFAGNGPDNTSSHRRAVVPVAGSAWLAQRFATDFMRFDPQGRAQIGDGKRNQDYAGYGQEAIAVADARVLSVVDGVVENVPGKGRAVPITLATVAGNQVSLDLGGGFTAFYAHLQPGSVRVKVGDRVKRGQVLGLVGNSGNSTGPHLHFQIARGGSILGSEGVPFVYREYQRMTSPPGTPPADARTEKVRGEMPLLGDIVIFPDAAAPHPNPLPASRGEGTR